MVCLGDTSDMDGSEGALNNPERHTFDLPVVGRTGSLLPRRAGCVRVRLRAIRDGRRSIVIVLGGGDCGCSGCYVCACDIG